VNKILLFQSSTSDSKCHELDGQRDVTYEGGLRELYYDDDDDDDIDSDWLPNLFSL
jgi:hypothetical protein